MREVFVLGLFLSVGGSVFAQNQGTNSFIGVGANMGNRIPTGVKNAGIVSGVTNTNAGNLAFIGGGGSNVIQTNSIGSLIGGGQRNVIESNINNAVISGGSLNRIDEKSYASSDAFIGGGLSNLVSGLRAVVSGGSGNKAVNWLTTVSGGSGNTASGHMSTVSGGAANTASGLLAFVGGGTGMLPAAMELRFPVE